MKKALRSLRRHILTPGVSETKMETRGFHVKSPESRELLETIGGTFLQGYAHVMEARSVTEAEGRLEEIPRRFRGFAYEGAGMGCAVLDGLPFGSGSKVDDLLAGRGRDHVYMVYIGIGWAMARLPRFRWPKSTGLDPLLLWLVHDGFGFHQAYFHTRRYIDEQYQDPGFPWPARDPRSYADRAIDQGIGRAMWFIGGTDADRVASMIDKFPERRNPDLWSGVGLAATYAGGASAEELRRLCDRAGTYRSHLAQGSAFAAEARVRAGLLTPQNEVATQVLCGTTPEHAAWISLDTRPNGTVRGGLPAYEVWRRRLADQFASLGGVTP
ncbi:DUF1702 family protein [Streptosporangium sp. NPDC049644]|uniref:DUF1702 family protein n=1 Tax=Streptosporangium sp. NPDC049644 TaxID=3155507 RepID=UPI003417886C